MLKKCKIDNTYTLKDKCPKCGNKTDDAHYKFIKVKSAEITESSD